jgi:L-2-hydroxyglutarate oxidase
MRLAARHFMTGLGEVVRSASKAAFVRSLQRLVPDLRPEHLERAPAGVRAQSLRPDGTLESEFVILGEGGQTHVCNAPSPGATASIAIAEHVADAVLGG